MVRERVMSLSGRQWTRREVLVAAGAALFVAACGGNDTHSSTQTPTAIFGPYPETPTQAVSQLAPDQFIASEQQLYQTGHTVDVLLQDRTLLLNPTLGNAALLEYIGGTEQGVSVNDIFRITLQSSAQGAPIHGIVPKDSQAGQVLLPASQRLPNIVAFEGPVVNVKILTFSDKDIYADQGFALLCQNLRTR